ncbi:MAG: hypothetical protein LBS38_00565 [Endomicrobium sp.]|nr:hypothetical protein [Endomicrobium sp.]
MNSIKVYTISIFSLFVFCANVFATEAEQQFSYDPKEITESLSNINISNNKKERIKELELLAEEFTDKKLYNKAIDIYSEIFKKKHSKKNLFKYYVKVGDLYSLKKNYVLSLDYYERALSINKKSSDVMIRIGRIFLDGNLFELAEEKFLGALKIDKHSVGSKKGIGDVYYKRGIYTKAINYYNKIPKDLYDREIVRNISRSFINLNKSDEAAAILEYYLKEHDDSELMFNLAVIYIDKCDYLIAQDWLLKTLKINDGAFKVYVYLAYIYDLESKYKESLKMLNKAYALNSSYGAIDFMRAKAAYKVGMIKEAKTYANEAYNKARTIFVKDQAQKLLEYLNKK